MAPAITRIILYVKDIPKVAEFYQRHFAMRPLPLAMKGWMELTSKGGGCNIAHTRPQCRKRAARQ